MAKKQKNADGGLSQSVTHLLHRVLQIALDYHAEASGPMGLTQRQFTVLAAAWFIAVQLFASGVGGYIAGRLRTGIAAAFCR